MIHPTAIVDSGAVLADDVEVSAYSIIGKGVSIDSGTWIGPHVVIQGPTEIGKNNRIYQFSSIGEIPQDKKYKDEPTRLKIGDRNIIREFCTFNRGTTQDRGETVLGDDNWIMAYVHLAHDCVVGDHTVFANGATLAGHVEIENYAILGGFTVIHQFCRVGQYAFTGMGAIVGKDIPPYIMVKGEPGAARSVNVEGLKRHGFSTERIAEIKQAYRTLYRSGLRFDEALMQLESNANRSDDISYFIDFCRSTQRGVVRP